MVGEDGNTVTVMHMHMHDLWEREAACRGLDPTIFYPVSEEEAAQAKAVCSSCAIQENCLEYALGERERDGVWGGATERERRRIIRRRRRTA